MNYYITVLKNYATFTGRARRSEFWYFVLFTVIISVVLNLISSTISTIYNLAVLIPSIAVSIRRMHDIGMSGWFILIPIYDIYLATIPGNHGENQYGADPKANITE